MFFSAGASAPGRGLIAKEFQRGRAACTGRPMDRARLSVPDRLLDTLERLFRVPSGDLKVTLTHVANLIAEATG